MMLIFCYYDYSYNSLIILSSTMIGFCFMHRLLLWFMQTYPEVKKQIDLTVMNFVNNEEYRHKKVDRYKQQ